MRLLMLVLAAISLVACSDRVPAPVTPTPSPRPGYPPAPVSELPEGVLFVSKPTGQPPLFGLNSRGEWDELVQSSSLRTTSPDGMRAALVTFKGNWPTGVGLLAASSYNEAAAGPWSMGSPVTLWSSDGTWLAYTVPDDAAGGMARVWTLDTRTGEKALLTPEADFYSPLGWTAAGEVLVSTSQGLLLVGKKRHPIDLPEPGSVLDAQVSPDGRSVAVKLGQYEYREADQVTYIRSNGIWVLEFASGRWREVLDLDDDPPEVQTIAPTGMEWSPDGRRISTHLPQFDGYVVFGDALIVLDVSTGDKTEVHRRGWGQESWSRDGRYLAYLYYTGGSEGRQLGILRPDGRLRDAEPHPRGVAWAETGRLLVDIPGHLSLLDPETMETKEVVTDDGKSISGLVEAAVWSPSGRYVALSTPSDAYYRSSLYVVDTEEGTAELFLGEAGFSAVAWLQE